MAFEDAVNEQSLFLNNRKSLSVSGVKDIISFDETTVKIVTSLGNIALRGTDFKIDSFNTESGDIKISGKFNAIVYYGESNSKDSFIKKLLR
ncbi:MAG: YabP/YqfC family sporulation protein [Acutalibacteraceae bacterium]|nr:YabP/YqfC family sporulation protein [Acutalibacteraceae bacterium]